MCANNKRFAVGVQSKLPLFAINLHFVPVDDIGDKKSIAYVSEWMSSEAHCAKYTLRKPNFEHAVLIGSQAWLFICRYMSNNAAFGL